MKKIFSVIIMLCLLAGILLPRDMAKAAELTVKEVRIDCGTTPKKLDVYTYFEINTATVTFSNGKTVVLNGENGSLIKQSKDGISYSIGIQLIPISGLYSLSVEIYDEKNNIWIDEITGNCKAFVNGESWGTEDPNTLGLHFYSKNPPKANPNAQATAKAIEDAKAVIAKGFCARIRNKLNNDHIFTLNPAEAESLLKQAATYEHETRADGSNSFQASLTKTGPYDQAVYAVLHKNAKIHLYTHENSEMNSLLGNGNWTADRGTAPLFYTISKPENGSIGIYRAFNPVTGKQHYCRKGEYDGLIANYKWKPNFDSLPLWYTN